MSQVSLVSENRNAFVAITGDRFGLVNSSRLTVLDPASG